LAPLFPFGWERILRAEQPPSVTSPGKPGASWRTRLPFFYGWVVVGSAFLNEALAFGVYYSFSVFFVALLQDFGWSRAATAGVFSVFVLVSGLMGVAAGALTDRFGPSKLVPVGAGLMALGLLASSRLTQLWQFYLFFGVVTGVGHSLCGWVPTVAVVGRWFSIKRGVALGIAGAGIGLGIVVMVPLCQYIISGLGWRTAYQVLAMALLVVVAPQAALLQVRRPQDLGLKPDGQAGDQLPKALQKPPSTTVIKVVDEKWATFPWSAASALRTARFWFLAANFCLTSVYNQMLWAHEVAYLVDVGYEKMLAASATGLSGLVSMPSKILWGAASDRLGRELAFTLGIVSAFVAILVLVAVGMVPSVPLVFLFVFLFGAGYAVSAPVLPAAAADIFVGRNFGSIYGVLFVGTSIGSAVGPFLAGYVFDVTGSYLAAFAVAAASSCIAALCMWLAAPRKVRRVARGGF